MWVKDLKRTIFFSFYQNIERENFEKVKYSSESPRRQTALKCSKKGNLRNFGCILECVEILWRV